MLLLEKNKTYLNNLKRFCFEKIWQTILKEFIGFFDAKFFNAIGEARHIFSRSLYTRLHVIGCLPEHFWLVKPAFPELRDWLECFLEKTLMIGLANVYI